MIAVTRPLVLTLALATGISAPGIDIAAAPQESRTISPGEAAGLVDVFVPSLGGADYVVTLRVQRGGGPSGSDTQVVTRRGDWMRIDRVDDGSASTRYLGLVHDVRVDLSRNRTGGYSYVRIVPRPRSGATGMDYRSFKTGETDVALGEPCDVWNVYRHRPDATGRGGFVRLGCVTVDGIELWRRTVGDYGVLSSAHAVRVERRSVNAKEVRLPDDLLSLERRFGTTASARDAGPAGKADFELVLHATRSGEPAMTVRRRYPWRYEEWYGGDPWSHGERYGEGKLSRLSVRREDQATELDVLLGPQGAAEELVMSSRPLDDQTPTSQEMSVPLPEPPETVLGERCTWVNLTPNTADSGRHECRTRDGIPLRIRFLVWGQSHDYSAIRLSRRPIEFSEVMPPPELLERSRWRLPE
jgi:hypothetical protein